MPTKRALRVQSLQEEVSMVRIVPHIWFQDSLAEAGRLYGHVVPGSKITSESSLDGTPSGKVAMATWFLGGLQVQALAAPAPFTLNPSFSLLLACEGPTEVDRIHARLVEGGSELMPLGTYPFSPRYAWVIDRFGLSWQIMDYSGRRLGRRVTPTLMFTGTACGRCEEAMRAYAGLIPGSAVGELDRYGPGMEPNQPEQVKHGGFTLAGTALAAMDSALSYQFSFNEAASFIAFVETQAELDGLWAALSADPEAERCGWLKDRFGLSWQVVPEGLGRIMASDDDAARSRTRDAFLAMRKLDIAALERAARGD
jgi:predicted 3-demethylubiquinone-9 3-methyltransferase (glyoxalase superfamily)